MNFVEWGMSQFTNSLVAARNQWLILFSKFQLLLNLVKTNIKIFKKLWRFQIFAHFQLASVVVELLAILWFFTIKKFQNLSGTHAATCSLSYKSFTIVNYTSVRSLSYDYNFWSWFTILDKAMIVNYDHNYRFIVLAIINTFINYNGKTFFLQATGGTNW